MAERTRHGQDWEVAPQFCSLSLYGSSSRPAARHASLRDDMFWLLTNNTAHLLSDIYVASPGTDAVLFPAHKTVLASRIKAIDDALDSLQEYTGDGETRKEVLRLPVRASPAAVQSLLCFIYCGTLGRRQMPDADLTDLRALALAWDVPRLVHEVDSLRPCSLLEAQSSEGTDARMEYYKRMRSDSVLSTSSNGLSFAASSPEALSRCDSMTFTGTTPPNLSAFSSGSSSTPFSPPLMVGGGPPPDTWAKDMRSLGQVSEHRNWSGAVCVLTCAGIELKVSTALLVARSDFHQRVFLGEWSPELGADGLRHCPIEGDAIDPQALADLVRFLACDNVGFVLCNDFERVYRMAEVAEYWMLDHLFQRCQEWLSKFASPETVAPLWNAAHQLRASATCELCKSIVVSRFGECAEAPDFPMLEKEHLKTALDSGKIACPTHVVIGAIERWARHQLMEQDSFCEVEMDVPADAVYGLVKDLLPPSTMFNAEMKFALLGLGCPQRFPGIP